jgi:hypothetical protein
MIPTSHGKKNQHLNHAQCKRQPPSYNTDVRGDLNAKKGGWPRSKRSVQHGKLCR